MKLKEYPKFWYQAWKLNQVNTQKVQKNPGQTLPIVVSLTSIPSRFQAIAYVVKCLLSQSQLPEKIILWIHESARNQIPNKLEKLQGSIFQIRTSQLDSPHLKLVESLQNFPNSNIVTVDDDLIYHSSFLEDLYQTHLQFPKAVVANRCREIKYQNHKALPYSEWNFIKNFTPGNTNQILPLGAFGVLYPPNSLAKIATDSETYLQLTPTADDLWFKACTIINQNDSIPVSKFIPEPIPIPNTQKIALKKINKKLDQNRIQWDNLVQYFQFKTS